MQYYGITQMWLWKMQNKGQTWRSEMAKRVGQVHAHAELLNGNFTVQSSSIILRNTISISSLC